MIPTGKVIIYMDLGGGKTRLSYKILNHWYTRRVCVGMNLANNALFINMVSVLWAVTVNCPLDANGQRIVPDRTKFIDDGLVV